MVLWHEFFFGWIAGITGLIVGHPLDTVKVVQQTKCISILASIRQVYKNIGISVFFGGIGVPLATTGVLNGIFFGSYENSMEMIGKCQNKDNLQESVPYLSHFFAGCVGGFVQLGLGCPVDVIKVQLQGRPASDVKNSVHCVQQILRRNGVAGLYKGVLCLAWRDIPSSGVYFVVYEFSKRQLEDKLKFGGTKGVHFVSGGIAGVFSWWSTLPFDVVKSRLQGDCRKQPVYRGMMHCTSVILKTNGINGLLQGFWILSIRGFLVNGMIFQTYEYLLKQYSHLKIFY